MNMITKAMSALLVLFGAVTSLQAQVSADADGKLKQLERISNAIDFGGIMEMKFREGVEDGSKQNAAMLTDEMMDHFVESVIDRFDMDEFLETVALPVLDPYFSLEELEMIADFVESDLGTRLATSAIEGNKTDFEDLMANGEVSEEDGMKMMQLMIRLSSKKSLLEDGKLGKEFETAAAAYGEAIVIDVMTEMMEEYAE